MTIYFNRYNLCFDKYTECGDKCKPLYFIALHIRVVSPLFSQFCGMFAIRYNVLSDRVFPQVCYRTLVKYKGSVFLGIFVICGGNFIVFSAIRLEKCVLSYDICSEKCNNSCI